MRKLFYILMLLVVTGCSVSRTRTEALEEAQRLMYQDPSAALAKLNDIDVSEFSDSATMARWALLYSEAMVESHLAAPSDTIVNIAVDYYGRHNLLEEYLKASALKKRISTGSSDDRLAVQLYIQKEKEFLLYKERTTRELYTAIGIVCLLVLLGMIIWLRQRVKLQQARNMTLMAEASGLRCRIDAREENLNRLESKLHGLLETRFSLIDSLCQTYYESQGTKAERRAIIDKVRSEIEAVKTDSFCRMEQAVNDCRSNLLLRVRETFPAMKEEEYRLLVYLASGLSTRAISLLLGESVEVIYKRKSRLKARLKESFGQEIALFF